MNANKEIFALDIGTRSVVGLIAQKSNQKVLIKEIVSREHITRAMIDGQIHDIKETSKAVEEIKHELEEKLGYHLYEAAVAAAGRTLLTIKTSHTQKMTYQEEITAEDVKQLELTAVRKALDELKDNNKGKEYHCVGYSVINYKLEDQIIGNLLDQKGREISVEIVATFLPRVVVDSLLTVLERSGLKLRSLTLEPIAASHVIVPQSMRKINIALVDIGAGTSDIAISRDGSIIAYGMVPMAGDEVTECLSEKFLLDFDTAERVKRELSTKEETTFTDILGTEHTMKCREIIKGIMDSIDTVSKNIAKKIVELNGKLPQAVLCVGGGSLTPGLCHKLANHLGMPVNRVGVKHGSHILNLEVPEGKNLELNSPLVVTPIGIAVNSFDRPGLGIIKVFVNKEPVQLFEFTRPTVFDALSQKGIKPAQIFGSPGMALTFELNGKLKVIKGKRGKPGEIKVNGVKASLDTCLKQGDNIAFIPGEKGDDGKLKVKELLKYADAIAITVNGRKINIEPEVWVNGEKADADQEIPDRSRVTIKNRDLILSDVLRHISLSMNYSGGILVTKINGKKAKFTSPVKNGDSIEIFWENAKASGKKGSVL